MENANNQYKDIPIYTGYTEKEIEDIKKKSIEIGKLQERKRMIEEQLKMLEIEQIHNEFVKNFQKEEQNIWGKSVQRILCAIKKIVHRNGL